MEPKALSIRGEGSENLGQDHDGFGVKETVVMWDKKVDMAWLKNSRHQNNVVF